MNELKVIRDGKVAVLISTGFGAGWYTWNTEYPACLYHPSIVSIVEKGRDKGESASAFEERIEAVAKELFGEGFYTGGADGLRIAWVPLGTAFQVEEYDGSEALVTAYELPLVA